MSSLTLNCVAENQVQNKGNLGPLTNLLWWYLQYPQYLTLSASDPCSSHNSPANWALQQKFMEDIRTQGQHVLSCLLTFSSACLHCPQYVYQTLSTKLCITTAGKLQVKVSVKVVKHLASASHKTQ